MSSFVEVACVFVQLGKKSNALLLILKFCLENSWRTNKRPLTQLPVVCQSRSDTCLIAVSMLDLVCVLGLFILGIGFFFAWNSSIEFVMSEPFFFPSPRPPPDLNLVWKYNQMYHETTLCKLGHFLPLKLAICIVCFSVYATLSPFEGVCE